MAIIHEKGPGGRGGRSTRAQSTALFLDLVGKRILDTGCKEGYNSFDLAELGAAEVVGIELRENFLEEARAEKARQHFDNVQFVVADARRIDEAGLGSFDICLCTGLLYHMQDALNLV
ncbi:MAG: class I SAM-dependent methyltransferase, partial [Chthoniobacterales bacterium]